MPVTVYPTGTTIYDPARCWNGYTVFQPKDAGAVLIDMNGNVVNQWRGLSDSPGPFKVLPGGYVMGSTGVRDPNFGFQDNIDLVQADWDGRIVWQFKRYELVRDGHRRAAWMARQHHDFQREGNPVGYYVPGMSPFVDKGRTLIVCHKNVRNPHISDQPLLDDVIIDVAWSGEIVWEWRCNEHFDEMGFGPEARAAIAQNPNMRAVGEGMGDWLHLNSASLVGPNRWFDCGDARFHPDNIIWSSRQTNILAITSRKTGEIVWRVGPDYAATGALRKLGQIIGPHHVHMIPRGLPGEGNILVFDNGGWAGYGAPNPGAPEGHQNALRDYSRVVEFNPVTLEVVWQYSGREAGFAVPSGRYQFYSPLVSSAQRLPNGNTLITEGVGGRLFEITRQFEIVWEYVNPYYEKARNQNMVYRSYRLPYQWIPQVGRPEETALKRIDNSGFRVPGYSGKSAAKVTRMARRRPGAFESQECVLPGDVEPPPGNRKTESGMD